MLDPSTFQGISFSDGENHGWAKYSDQNIIGSRRDEKIAVKQMVKISFSESITDCNPDHPQPIDRETVKAMATEVAKAFGRIPDYLRGVWSEFNIGNECK